MSSKIRFPIIPLLGFYDESPETNNRHTAAVTSVLGEELGAGLLLDYFHRQGITAEALNQPCTQGTFSGKRLDRWVKITQGKHITHYQVEIKNWAASAIGGRKLAIGASKIQLRAHKIERWSREWDGNTFIKEQVRKVLTPMKPPKDATQVEPMVCYWDAMHPIGKADALFSVPVPSGKFNRVWVFSMSAHLRNLMNSGEEFVEIDAPASKARLLLLKKLIH